MALSEEEKQLLAQLEASLSAEDPKFASTLQGTKTRRVHRRRAAVAGLVFILGLVALVGGIRINEFISVGGFILMVAAAIVATTSWQHVNDLDPTDRSEKKPRSPHGGSSEDDQVKHFMSKMEERWRKRQEGGL